MKFLINTFTHWEEPPRARHQVAYALAKQHTVVFVAANKIGFPGVKFSQKKENITLVQPRFFVGNKIRYRIPVLNEFYQHWLYSKLRKLYGDFSVINFDFTATRVYRYFQDVIFYYNDNLAAISKRLNPGVIARYHEKAEATVATKAKFCVSVTPLLKEKLQKFNPNSYEIPLGGPDITEHGIEVNEKVAKNGPIRVGLVGFISDYSISSHTINFILNQVNMELVVVGPVEDAFMEKLANRDRLILKGTLTGRELFQEINMFDIAIAPYCQAITKDDSVGVGTGSKMYQYLSLGKPVVISDMVGLHNVSFPEKFLYIAGEDQDFPALINKAQEENTTAVILDRKKFAEKNTWEKRMEKLIEIYNKI